MTSPQVCQVYSCAVTARRMAIPRCKLIGGVKGLAASGSARYAAQRASSEERG